jgi:uncharacterized protein YdbL (DUF1318 family)
MSASIRLISVVLASAAIAACVTINVYFPEAAAERAADRFIQDVIGPEGVPADDLGWVEPVPQRGLLARVGDFLIPSAHAQSADIDIASPQIDAIKQRMAQRHRDQLADWFEAGAIGLGNDGLVAIRDRSAVGLADRRKLEQAVTEENADRRAVYREIAVANGHADWEQQIRDTFARRWIANARPGWYYQDESGAWQQK